MCVDAAHGTESSALAVADSEAVEAVAAAPLHVDRMDLEVVAGEAESLLDAGSILGCYLPE